jgi:hypothetical protein
MMAALAPMVAVAGGGGVQTPRWPPCGNRDLFPPLQLRPLRHPMQAALPLRSGKQGSWRCRLVGSPPAAAAVEGCPRLHPPTKLPIPAVNTIHTFSAQSKLCFVRDRLSGKVDTGTTLSLLSHQSAAAATRPKLQSVKGQPIKMWNLLIHGWNSLVGKESLFYCRLMCCSQSLV